MRYMRVKSWMGLALFGICSFLLSALPTQAASERPVLALYYMNYSIGNWSYDWMSDRPAPLYSSSDGDAMYRHIDQAHEAGIDGFICVWEEHHDPTDTRCSSLHKRMKSRKTYDMKIAYLLALSAQSDPKLLTLNGLAKALNTLRDEVLYEPGYLRIQGKPAVFMLNPKYFGEVEDWSKLRNQIDLKREQFWLVGTTIPALEAELFNYLNVFDAVYLYDVTNDSLPTNALATYAQRLQQFNQSHQAQKPFIASVSPGFDDLRVNSNGHRRDRANGTYYQSAWSSVGSYNPTAVILNSFNNFYEGNQIEPSEVHATLYMELTRKMIDQFRAIQPQSSQSAIYFPQTGHYIKGAFRSYWQQQGGIARFGYPITEEFIRSDDNKIVQYFERARFELRVVNNQAVIDLGLLGREYAKLYKAKFDPVPPVENSYTRIYFPQTGHTLEGGFKSYWESQGGLPFFGYPISEPMTVEFPDGVRRVVQYFERTRFELHNGHVLTGLLGRDLAPCELQQPWGGATAPDSPLTNVNTTPCKNSYLKESKSNKKDVQTPVEALARGRVYPQVVRPNTVQGFEGWDFAPGEQISMWLNLPDTSVRSIPYMATADNKGYVLIGFQTERVDPEGAWSLVAKGVDSGRVVVAPFQLKW